MARIKYSGLIDEINGSIGGTTFQRNRYGFTIKRKPAGKKGGSPSQLARRLSMYRVQQNWIGLSAADRANWVTYASTFPTATRLNPNVYLNGVNLFEKYHLLKALLNEFTLTNPSGPQRTLSFGLFQMDSDLGILTAQSNITLSGGNWIYFLFVSRPVRETTSLAKNQTRFVSAVTAFGNSFEDIAAKYTALYGFLPVRDDFIQYRRVYINQTNGQIFDEGVQLVQVAEM
jgi:hypothetical protein